MQNAAVARDRRIRARLHKIWRVGAAKLVDQAFEGRGERARPGGEGGSSGLKRFGSARFGQG